MVVARWSTIGYTPQHIGIFSLYPSRSTPHASVCNTEYRIDILAHTVRRCVLCALVYVHARPVPLAAPVICHVNSPRHIFMYDHPCRCILAECRGEIVATAFGGIHAHVFLGMNHAERRTVIDALIGREFRCVVGSNGAGDNSSDFAGDRRGGSDIGVSHGGDVAASQTGGWGSSGVKYRIERIAIANPAADLAHLL